MARLSRFFSSARARVVGGVFAAVVLLVGTAGVSANINVQSDSQRANSWVATHQGALPRTLETFAAYPIAYQHAIFDALPAADKSRLWQDQLTRLLARPNLTVSQQAFIRDAIAKATPESFGPLADHPELCESIVKIFPDKDTKQVFSHLGIVATPAFSVRASLVTITEAVRAKLVLNADGLGQDCNCRGEGWCECDMFSGCEDATCNAANTCGCIWSGPCDQRICVSGLGGAEASSAKVPATPAKTVK